MAETSKRVDAAIKECHAKLAGIHFTQAAKVIGAYVSPGLRQEETIPQLSTLDEQHMERVEKYLKRAGADATRFHFTANTRRD